MVVLRHYTKEGVLSRPALTSPTQNGAICHIGSDKYACCSALVLQLFSYGGDGITLDKQIATFPSGAPVRTAKGVECDRAGKLWVTRRFDIPSSPSDIREFAIEQYDLDSGAVDTPLVSLGGSNNEGGIAFNGNQWWVSFQGTTVPKFESLWNVELDGATPFTANNAIFMEDAAPAGAYAEDMCFDGIHLWTLQAGVVICYEMDGRRVPSEVFRFTPAGTSKSGLTTDGVDLLVMSRT
jgi:hypothetical protein